MLDLARVWNQQGRSRVWSGECEMAEHYMHTLQQWQLTAILEADDQN